MKHLLFASLVAVVVVALTVPVQARDYSQWTTDLLRQNCEFQAEKARSRNSAKNYKQWAVFDYEFRQEHGQRRPYCQIVAICRLSGFYGTAREAEGRYYTSNPSDPWYQSGDPIDQWHQRTTWTTIGETERLRCCINGRLEMNHTRC